MQISHILWSHASVNKTLPTSTLEQLQSQALQSVDTTTPHALALVIWSQSRLGLRLSESLLKGAVASVSSSWGGPTGQSLEIAVVMQALCEYGVLWREGTWVVHDSDSESHEHVSSVVLQAGEGAKHGAPEEALDKKNMQTVQGETQDTLQGPSDLPSRTINELISALESVMFGNIKWTGKDAVNILAAYQKMGMGRGFGETRLGKKLGGIVREYCKTDITMYMEKRIIRLCEDLGVRLLRRG
jgi:hypothetical protein